MMTCMTEASAGRAASLRARVRAEMTDEIKRVAREHLASAGAPNLSLRAVARERGMVSSAVDRYFPSRDELLTALILDAYNALGEAVEEAEAAIDRADLVARHRIVCTTVRGWALANPHEYALTYGTPVPGYAAPQATVEPAGRVPMVLTRILHDGVSAGILRPHPADWLPPAVMAEMNQLVAATYPGIPAPVMARGVISWTELFGAVSFEVFGRFNGMIEARDEWFEHQVHAMARLVGLRP
jgi:AcrR family transcriptional regulator